MSKSVTLTLEAVSVRYGSYVAVENLSLTMQGGEIFGLLGPNGSGKSTTLSACAGILEPCSGTITIDQFQQKTDPYNYAHRVGYVPQEIALYEELSAWDNLAFFGHLYGIRGRELKRRSNEALVRVDLLERADDLVRTFSGGMQRRLHLACALLHRPTVLLLDEPTVALDPVSRDTLFRTLNRLREDGCTIVLTTHHFDEAEQNCDRVGILSRGRLIHLGSPADLSPLHASRSVLIGKMREEIAEWTETALRNRLGKNATLVIRGRQLRLSADDPESLAQALAVVFASGVELESFRTPPPRLEHLLENESERVEPLDVIPFPYVRGAA